MTCAQAIHVHPTHVHPSPPHTSVLYVAGEVDSATAPCLRAELAYAGVDPTADVVIDMSGVTFMSCSGLRPLLEAQARLGQRLWLRAIPRPVTRLLDLTHQHATFQVIDHRTSVESDQLVDTRGASGRGGPAWTS